MEKEKLIKESEDFGAYEDFTEDDFFNESWDLDEDYSEIGEFDLDDFGIYDVDEDLESGECDEAVCKPLSEDLISSFPVHTMSESQVRDAAKKVVKGAKVKFKYVKELKLASNYALGKFVKKDNVQYPLVKAIKVTEVRACTGVNYVNTRGAKLLHGTQQYQDKLAARRAAGLGGFGTNVHDAETGLENILVTTASGKKCILAYPLVGSKPKNTYYISVDGEDWRVVAPADKMEIAQYMTPGDADKFLHPATDIENRLSYQSTVHNNNGETVTVDFADLVIRDVNTGEKIKVNSHPLNITYVDPKSPFFGVCQFDKESAVVATLPAVAEEPAKAESTVEEKPEEAPVETPEQAAEHPFDLEWDR